MLQDRRTAKPSDLRGPFPRMERGACRRVFQPQGGSDHKPTAGQALVDYQPVPWQATFRARAAEQLQPMTGRQLTAQQMAQDNSASAGLDLVRDWCDERALRKIAAANTHRCLRTLLIARTHTKYTSSTCCCGHSEKLNQVKKAA